MADSGERNPLMELNDDANDEDDRDTTRLFQPDYNSNQEPLGV